MQRTLTAALALAVLLALLPELGGTAPTAAEADAQSFTIVEPVGGAALGLTRTGSDPTVTIDPYSGSRNQLWHLVDIGGGYSEIVNEGTGKALSTLDGQTGDGAVVHLFDYLGSFPDQHWQIADAGGGTVTIANQGTGNRLLSTKDGQTAAGTETQLWSRTDGRAGQVWKLVPTTVERSIAVHSDVVGQVPQTDVATGLEDVNHEIYGGLYSQLIYGEAFQEPAHNPGVSGMWRPVTTGNPVSAYSLDTTAPFKGTQDQRITFTSGSGGVGVENSGLNRQGIGLNGRKPYEGKITLRTAQPQNVTVTLQNTDGSRTYARTVVRTQGTAWRTYDFALTPSATDAHARFVVQLGAPGTADLGYAFLQPGSWGRFHGLPVRKDVVDAMVAQGLKSIRFGGCANSGCGDVSDYKWKNMIGDPATRPATKGFWFPYESNGWGILDFLNLGEAMGIDAVPSMNIDETPQDMADFMQYLYGGTGTVWGAKRLADGHPTPYTVRRFELGNENAVDDTYWTKFKALADVIWKFDPKIRLVVGDFAYSDVITDPFNFTGGGKVNTLAAHQKILNLAKQYGTEVDFDIHLWTQDVRSVPSQIRALDSYVDQLGKIAPGVNYKVVVFELNADRHDLARAIANAYAINTLQRRPKVDVVSSANALQVDGQNDSGWDQGLVFFDQLNVWGQPPYYVDQMKSASWQPNVLHTDVTGDDQLFDVTALTDGTKLTIDIVNGSTEPLTYTLRLDGFRGRATVSVLEGRPTGVNTSSNPRTVIPTQTTADLSAGSLTYTFFPNSYTSFRIG